MASIEAKFQQKPVSNMQKYSLGAQVGLRILAVVGTLAATTVMGTNKQSTVVYGLAIDARYSYSSAFKFFVIANGIACAFTALSLVSTFILSRRGSKPNSFFFLFLHDLFVMSLVMAGSAAATAIGYVGRYGNSHTGWMPLCDHFGKFCNKSTAAVLLSYLSFIFLLLLTIISANRSRQIQV
ncbi:hypothetical protein L1049_027920 [Liquidambar formosana]|uniref:CASP-like protein n=1 Tax=Liquidambar formosana TaxID=63359 RepID=A0AAP0RIV3_LIQFO